jgi:hypothetical protein
VGETGEQSGRELVAVGRDRAARLAAAGLPFGSGFDPEEPVGETPKMRGERARENWAPCVNSFMKRKAGASPSGWHITQQDGGILFHENI